MGVKAKERKEVMRLLMELHGEGSTIIMVGDATSLENAPSVIFFNETQGDRYKTFMKYRLIKVQEDTPELRAEIQSRVKEIIPDQNMSFTRSVASTYTQNKVNSIVGRYYSVQFIYNLRAFGLWADK